LEVAQAVSDEKVLTAFQLVTNDGVKREAPTVTTELVEKLKKDGMNPVWCVSEAWLESKYGRKGEPRPEQTESGSGREEKPVPPSELNGNGNPSSKTPSKKPDSSPEQVDHNHLPDNIEFLKERIRVLEQEKQREIERNERREAKLFEQLEVKDNQISAWDEVMQGLTRGLATGMITPTLPAGSTAQSNKQEADTGTASAPKSPKTEISAAPPKSSVASSSVVNAEEGKKGTASQSKRRTPKAKTASAKKQPTKKKVTREVKRATKQKRHWLNTPITELFSRDDK
jgi:hypothetical protein